MFMYAKRLSYNMADPASLREQVRAYLVAKNTLALRPSVDAHISVTVQPEFNHTQRKIGFVYSSMYGLTTNSVLYSTKSHICKSWRY